jgi:hypothetical protein
MTKIYIWILKWNVYNVRKIQNQNSQLMLYLLKTYIYTYDDYNDYTSTSFIIRYYEISHYIIWNTNIILQLALNLKFIYANICVAMYMYSQLFNVSEKIYPR